MIKKIFYLLLLICMHTNAQSYSKKMGGHTFSMSIPNYMVKAYELNDDASLQYQNTVKEAYTIVIEDEIDALNALGMKFLDASDFLNYFLKDYQVDKTNRQVTEIRKFKSNQNNHAQVELTWEEDEESYYMLITTVESKTHLYKILCWTILDNKPILKNSFLEISKSLKD